MPRSYDPSSVEQKWQKRWEEEKVYETDLKNAKDPYYSLVMFPYPSGDKLHVGHWYNYAPADSFARYMRMRGRDTFSPMGFDAFGLPAENHAIKTGVHPADSTKKNVATMMQQLKKIGCMYDWSKTLNTSEPSYYQWTQWLFLQMYKHELAYKKQGNVNWCPSCQTVLANEQVWEGKCERCGSDVVQKALSQWYWKITVYAERLLEGHKDLDWPEKTILMQRNWIGKSEGVNIRSRVKDLNIAFEVYDSVPQTFCAQTFSVIAPEHPMVPELVKGTPQEKAILEFVEKIRKKKAAKRFNFEEDMEGIFTGRYVENPFGTGDLPIWIASFVVMEYGTGIVHCSAHDERDFAFAKKYGIPLRPVMFPEDPKEAERVRNLEYCYAKDPQAIMEKPEKFKGRRWGEVRSDIIDYMEKDMKIAKRAIHYRLRDWLLSRQRSWGAPIPIVYDPEGKPHPVPAEHLPWLLPTDVEFKPTGKSPLTYSKEFIERTERIFGKGWKPEFDTMDTFVCSSFYYLRYLMGNQEVTKSNKAQVISNKEGLSDKELIDPSLEKKWMPVSMYIGGPEHATMHLIYARFVMMALKDFGYVKHSEPFKRLVHQGLITNKGAKMSKSKGNVVSPDAFIERHGSDVFRMYLMFMGPFTDGGDWSDTGIKGIDRFVQRLWNVFNDRISGKPSVKGENPAKNVDHTNAEVTAALHKTIKKVTEDIEKLHFNTSLSALMELLNLLEKQSSIDREVAETFVKLLAPLAPHLADELWEQWGGSGFIVDQEWPAFDSKYLIATTLTIAVQVNGKVRGQMEVAANASEAEVLKAAKEQENVKRHLEGKAIKKEMYVKGRLVSLVV